MKLKPINKKGNLQDNFILMIILFATSVALFMIYYVFTQIQTPLGENLNATNADANQIDEFLTEAKEGLKTFDLMFAFFMLGLIFWVLISAYFVRSYPFMFFASVIVLIIAVFIGALLSNLHRDLIRENTNLKTTAADWPITNWIMNRLPFIALVVGLLTAILLYAKRPNEFSGGI